MGKKLAIRGHSTRGNEIIELLKMLGGYKDSLLKNEDITDENYFYFILTEENNAIDGYPLKYKDKVDEDYVIFTLEEFFEKYPFKVGDKVHIYVQNDDIDGKYDIEVAEIDSMRWNPVCGKIAYKMKNINREFYKEEIKCKVDDNHTKPSKMKNVLTEFFEHIKTIPKEELEREFNELEEQSHVGPTVEEFMDFCNKVNKKPKYPKTYKECCEIVNACHISITYDSNEDMDEVDLTLIALRNLIICRDAYWKIAGEQMGLGKSWEPNWTTFEGMPGIFRFRYNIVCDSIKDYHCLLVFPTEEMRDIFYENFKYLIEACKELL